MLVEDKIIEAKAHHSIMKILEVRKRLCCPECGSSDFYRSLTFDRCDIEYDDGHVEEGNLDYSHSDFRCDDCGYNSEY